MTKVEIGSESKSVPKCGVVDDVKCGFCNRYVGLFLSAFAHLCFSFTFLIFKCLPNYHPITVSVWRNAAILFPTIPILIYYKFTGNEKSAIFSSLFPMVTREKKLLCLYLLLRGIVATAANLLQVWCLKYLTVGDSSIFTFSAPVFVVVFASCFLGEKCGFVSSGVAILTFCGIALIIRPPILTGQTELDMDNLRGVVQAFCGMLLIALSTILVRRIRKVHWVVVLGAYGVEGLIGTMVVAGVLGVLEFPSGSMDSILVYGVLPIIVYLGQTSILLALKYEKAGPVSLVGTLGVLYSFLLQLAVFGTTPDIYSSVGASIVILGVMVTAGRKYIEELPLGHQQRTTFKLLLY